MGLDWLRYGKARKSKGKERPRSAKARWVKMRKGEEMVSNGKVARGQVKKSNGKVTTRLVWQGKRNALKSSG